MTNDFPLVTTDEIRQAADAIAPSVRRTPMAESPSLGKMLGGIRLLLKLEMFQKTGSFKPRGVANRMASLSGAERSRGVVSLSAGNHAQALAYAASAAGIASIIVMPSGAVRSKVEATIGYGGEVILTDGDLLQTALDIQRERDLTLIHPFDDLRTIAGTGTLGLEILEDAPEADTIICGIGGGGLISGVAASIKRANPNIRVIGVEPTGAPGMTLALEAGAPVHLDSLDTIADGLAAPFVGAHNLNHVRAFVDEVVTVEDADIIEAMWLIIERAKVIAEPAAAATVAALLSGAVKTTAGENVVCVLSGGNVDRGRLALLADMR